MTAQAPSHQEWFEERIAKIVFRHVWCECWDRRRVNSFDYHHIAAALVAELGLTQEHSRPGLLIPEVRRVTGWERAE